MHCAKTVALCAHTHVVLTKLLAPKRASVGQKKSEESSLINMALSTASSEFCLSKLNFTCCVVAVILREASISSMLKLLS